HGYDNSVTADAITVRGGDNVGVALVPVTIADAELRRLDAAGFRGARFHFIRHLGAATPIDDIIAFAQRLAAIGWHLQMHFESTDQPDFRALRELLRHDRRGPVRARI